MELRQPQIDDEARSMIRTAKVLLCGSFTYSTEQRGAYTQRTTPVFRHNRASNGPDCSFELIIFRLMYDFLMHVLPLSIASQFSAFASGPHGHHPLLSFEQPHNSPHTSQSVRYYVRLKDKKEAIAFDIRSPTSVLNLLFSRLQHRLGK